MNTHASPAQPTGQGAPGGQRFGRVTSGHPAPTGPGGPQGSYQVRDEDTGLTYWCGYADIVTEGLRTLRTGERIRFLIDLTPVLATPAT